MDILIALLVVASSAAFFVKRRREGARIAKTFGPDVHPKTVAALAQGWGKGALEADGVWIQAHERDLAERFRGQWIAVAESEDVAIGSTADEARRAAASSRPGRPPFVKRIS
jgi:hypothetical protein